MLHTGDGDPGDTGAPAHPRGRAAANLTALVGVLALNGLAGSGGLSGRSIGALAEAYPNAFLPAGWVFSIWSLIYLGLTGFAVHQALPGRREDPVLGRIGWAWVGNAVLNVGWITAFSFERYLLALLLMVGLVVSLVVINERIAAHRVRLRLRDRVLVAYPFIIYLAWISVALIANVFHFATVVGWDGFGVPGTLWSPVMMGVATALAAFLIVHRGAWPVALVVAWALLGIRARWPEVEPVATAGLVLAVVAVLTIPVGLTWRRARGAEVVVP